MQFVEIELDPREAIVAEAWAMMMDENIEMETIFGDDSKRIVQGYLEEKVLYLKN